MSNKLTQEELITKVRAIHGNRYDYSLVEYKNSREKIKIVCSKHGIFEQQATKHLQGGNCYKCSRESASIKNTKSNEIFIKDATEIHGNKYDYSLVEYTHNAKRVKIICKIHGIFEQTPQAHVSGESGCPICRASKGEIAVENYLLRHNIKYIREKKFNDCVYKRKLPFDFFLCNYNTIIEFDGKQHIYGTSFSKNSKNSKELIQIKDHIKNMYCIKNNIRLVRIPHTLINDIPIILDCVIR